MTKITWTFEHQCTPAPASVFLVINGAAQLFIWQRLDLSANIVYMYKVPMKRRFSGGNDDFY